MKPPRLNIFIRKTPPPFKKLSNTTSDCCRVGLLSHPTIVASSHHGNSAMITLFRKAFVILWNFMIPQRIFQARKIFLPFLLVTPGVLIVGTVCNLGQCLHTAACRIWHFTPSGLVTNCYHFLMSLYSTGLFTSFMMDLLGTTLISE